MATLLIVDDSAVDRKLVGGLLKGFQDVKLEYAVDGEAALARLQEGEIDVILTDLIMPNVDGMELLRRVQLTHADVPVVLMTGQGSERVAVEALQLGAIGYVPKTNLSGMLVETLQQVLDVSNEQRRYQRLMNCLSHTQYRFQLENDPLLIMPLVEMLQQIVFGMGVCGWTERGRLGIALDEALLNAIYHGNLELPPTLLSTVRAQIRARNTPDLLEDRAEESPFADRRVEVEATITRDEARFAIRDEGNGFDTKTIPDAGDPSLLEQKDGRGLVLIKSFADEVTFNDKGNELTLVKRRKL